MRKRLISAALVLCLLLALSACDMPFKKVIKGGEGCGKHIRLAFDEPPAQPLSLHVRGIAVTGALSKLSQYMTITIYDNVTRADDISTDPYHGEITIETNDNISDLINVTFDEAASEIVIEPVRPGIAFSSNTMGITVQLPIDNIIVEDGDWNVWYTIPSRGLTNFSAELIGVADSYFNFSGEQLDSLSITLNGADGAKLECKVNGALLTLDGTGSIHYKAGAELY